MINSLFYALEDFEYAVRCNCQCCVTDAEATTDAQVNEAKQKVLDAAQADVDAAVAAVVEEAAEGFDSIAGMIAKHTWDTPEGESIKLFLDDGPHSGPAVDWISKTLILLKRLNIEYAEEIRALIPTDALAEHDAKVRADALREAATICAEHEETFERREANGAAHGAGMCFKAIQALIEGEA